jgi:hypothetical protein
METLASIFAKYPGTDKNTLHSYADFYEKLLEPKRLQITTVLEVGVRDGSSLKAWKEYFPNTSHVVGIDDGSEQGFWTSNVAGIEVFVADTTKPTTVTKVLQRFSHGFFDLIIDDGLHKAFAQAATYGTLRPYLAPGGLYVIEDIFNYEEGVEMQKLFGGVLEDRRNLKSREDDVLLYFTN